MRHRERVLDTKTRALYATYEHWNESLTPPEDEFSVVRDTTITSYEKTESMDDVVTAGFHTKSGNGVVVNNPMTHVVTTVWNYPFSYDILVSYEIRHGSPGSYHWHGAGARWAGNQVLSAYAELSFLNAPVAPESDLLDLALSKAWSNVSLNEAQGMVMIAESEKTVASLVSLTRRFIRILKKVKKLDVKGLYGELTPKELADRYMELRYAIRPLLYDINGTIKALKYEAEKSPLRTTFRGNEFWSDETSQESHRHNGDFLSAVRTQYILKRAKTSFDVRAGVLAELDTLSSLPVWGMTEPLEALWEIVPFSFIVDWFFNVGDTIAAFTPNFGLNALASWTVSTKIVERTSEITRSTADWPDTDDYDEDTINVLNHVNSCLGGQVGELIITKQRTPNPSRSILPTLSVNLNTFKLIDLLIIAKHVWSR